MPKEDGQAFGKDLSTLGTYSIQGTRVSGTANKIEEFERFSSDPNEQEGYYLPISIEPWEGVHVRSSRNPDRWTALEDDGIVVIFLGKDAPDQVSWYETKDADGNVVRYSVDVGAAAAAAYAATRKKAVAKKTAAAKGK